MDTVIRIFRCKFTVSGRLRRDTAHFRAVFRRNPGNRKTDRLQYRDYTLEGRMYTIFSLNMVVNHRPSLQSDTVA